jgi:hypothetical protein
MQRPTQKEPSRRIEEAEGHTVLLPFYASTVRLIPSIESSFRFSASAFF